MEEHHAATTSTSATVGERATLVAVVVAMALLALLVSVPALH